MLACRYPSLGPLAALTLLAGCAAQGPFPSLAPRPVEKQAEPSVPEAPLSPAANDPALAARLAEALVRAQAGQAAFEASLPQARASISQAGPATSESWIGAQQALSGLEAARAPTVAALADLDTLAVTQRVAGTAASEADVSAIATAVARATVIAAGQTEEIDRLARSLDAL